MKDWSSGQHQGLPQVWGSDSSVFYFVTSGVDTPFGGVRVMYRCVDWLNDAGLPAAVVHRQRGFRCRWFDNRTRVLCADDVRVKPSDIVVFSEFRAHQFAAHLAPGAAKIIFNQAAYLTFRDFPLTPVLAPSPYLSPDVLGVIVVSEDSHRLLSPLLPDVRVERIHLGIDPSTYFTSEVDRLRQIAFQTRKGRAQTAQVLYGLRERGALTGWRLAPIENLPAQEVGRLLRQSTIYLHSPHESGESFSLQPAEAMACGALVVGPTGRGGAEFLRPEHSFPVADGDVLSCVLTSERILKSYDDELDRYSTMAAAGACFIRDEYPLERERQDVVNAFGRMADGTSRQPRSPRLDMSGLGEESTSRLVAYHLKEAMRAIGAGLAAGPFGRYRDPLGRHP